MSLLKVLNLLKESRRSVKEEFYTGVETRRGDYIELFKNPTSSEWKEIIGGQGGNRGLCIMRDMDVKDTDISVVKRYDFICWSGEAHHADITEKLFGWYANDDDMHWDDAANLVIDDDGTVCISYRYASIHKLEAGIDPMSPEDISDLDYGNFYTKKLLKMITAVQVSIVLSKCDFKVPGKLKDTPVWFRRFR